MDTGPAERRLLDAADRLFNDRGIQAVGIDAIRSESGISLKRLYQLFPSKQHLVEAVLHRRDHDIRAALESHTTAGSTPVDQVLAVFDYLHEWFSEPDFRGCAFINSYAELGGSSPEVADIVRAHKQALRDVLTSLVRAAGRPAEVADQLVILANGAMVTAAIDGTPETAHHARAAAHRLLTGSQ